MARNKKNSNNKHKVAPYNICDRFCEKCPHRKFCRVFRDANTAEIHDFIETRSFDDLKIVLKNLEKDFKKIKLTFSKIIKEKGINIAANKDGERRNEYQQIEKNFQKNKLLKMAGNFWLETDVFIKKFLGAASKNPFLFPALIKELDELSYYFNLIPAKLRLSYLQHYQDKPSQNAYFSACVALNACYVCEKNINVIIEETPELYIEGLKILTLIKNIETEILKNFPNVKNLKKQIIFNAETFE